MKKLLVFRHGVCPGRDEIDDYLEGTEVVRSDWIDMEPEASSCSYLETLAQHQSTWQVVFKDNDKYDQWHIAVHPECQPAGLVLEPYRFEQVGTLTIVQYTTNYTVLVYRFAKDLSRLLEEHLPAILASYRDGTYHHAIAPEILDPLVLQCQKAVSASSQ